MKAESFEPYIDFPGAAQGEFDLSLSGPGASYDLLRSYRWSVSIPTESALSPLDFRNYIQRSKAEFSVAKQGYVVSRSGWFSERSAAYLANGRPVLVQDSGLSDWLPVGNGVLAFRDPSEALAGIDDISQRYKHHCQEARAVAERYFDSRSVLTSLLDRAIHSCRTQRRRAVS